MTTMIDMPVTFRTFIDDLKELFAYSRLGGDDFAPMVIIYRPRDFDTDGYKDPEAVIQLRNVSTDEEEKQAYADCVLLAALLEAEHAVLLRDAYWISTTDEELVERLTVEGLEGQEGVSDALMVMEIDLHDETVTSSIPYRMEGGTVVWDDDPRGLSLREHRDMNPTLSKWFRIGFVDHAMSVLKDQGPEARFELLERQAERMVHKGDQVAVIPSVFPGEDLPEHWERHSTSDEEQA